jgi:hypothetical protein
MPTGNIREYLDLDLVVSSEEWNRTMRRETEIMRYQLLKDYLTGMLAILQQFTSPQVPSDAKKFMLQINDVGARAIKKILENFDEPEQETAVVDIRKTVDVEKCMQNSIDIIQAAQQQAMQQEQQAKEQLAMMGISPPPEQGQAQPQDSEEFSVTMKPQGQKNAE